MPARLLALALLLPVLFSAHQAAAESADVRLTGVSAYLAPPGGATGVEADFHNNGPAAAADFQVTISLGEGTTFLDVAVQPLLNCTTPPVGSPGTVTCTAKSLNNNDGGYVEVFARIDPSVTPGTVLSFPITMTSSNALQPSQSATATMTVPPAADLAISATAPAAVTAGDTFVSTAIVTNNGPADAIGVNFGVPQQGGAQVQQITGPAGWNCSTGACHANTFAPGTATFVVTSAVPATLPVSALTLKFEVDSSNDPDFRNNTAFTTTALTPAPRTTLNVTMSVTPENFYSGDTVTYTATTTNTGPSTAYNVNMGMSFKNGTVATTTCGDPYGTAVSCIFPSLAAGASQTITATVHVLAPPASQVTQSAFTNAFNAAAANASLTTTLNRTPPPNRRRAVHH